MFTSYKALADTMAAAHAKNRRTPADLRAEAAELADDLQARVDAAKAGAGDFTREEQAAWDRDFQRLGKLTDEIKLAEIDLERRHKLATTSGKPLPQVQGFPMTPTINYVGPALRAFKGSEGLTAAHRTGQWIKAAIGRAAGRPDDAAENFLQAHGMDIRASHIEGDPERGGYLVPTEMARALIEVRQLAGISRAVCHVEPMAAETKTIPKHADGLTVYYPGEGGTIPDSLQKFGQIGLVAKKRAILTKYSSELAEDSILSIADQIVSRCGFEFALKEDAELVNGDSTATYGGETGLLASLGSAGVFTPSTGTGKSVWTGLTLTEFTDTMAKLPSRFQVRNPVWLCSSEFYYGVMLRLLAAAGGNTVAHVEGGPAGRPLFMGREVYLTDQMPRTTATSQVSALYGSFRDAVTIGDRRTFDVAFSQHADFAEDLLSVRATTRYDINVHEGGSASAAGAYVGLSTAAS